MAATAAASPRSVTTKTTRSVTDVLMQTVTDVLRHDSQNLWKAYSRSRCCNESLIEDSCGCLPLQGHPGFGVEAQDDVVALGLGQAAEVGALGQVLAERPSVFSLVLRCRGSQK